MENTISTFEINANESIDYNYKAVKEFEQSLTTIDKVHKPVMFKHNPTSEEVKHYATRLEAYEQFIISKGIEDNTNKEIKLQAWELFEKYVKSEAGLFDIPQQYQEKVWNLAYQQGHSGGYTEVYQKLEELVEIFS